MVGVVASGGVEAIMGGNDGGLGRDISAGEGRGELRRVWVVGGVIGETGARGLAGGVQDGLSAAGDRGKNSWG